MLRRRGPAARDARGPRGQASGCSTRCSRSARSGSTSRAAAARGPMAASARDVSNFLIGGMTKADLDERRRASSTALASPTDMMLPPLPNFLFQRDPSSWIYGGVTINPMTKPARQPETVIMEAIYRFHPMFTADGGVNVWFGGVEQDWGRCTIEGGDVQPIGNGAVMIGMGERTTPAVGRDPRPDPVRGQGAARLVLAVQLPPSRSYMHLDTVMTMVDRDAVTLYPTVVNDDVRIWALRPGDDGGAAGRRALRGQRRRRARARARRRRACASIPTGGDSSEMEREQWDDGNNVVCARARRRRRLRAQRGHQHAPAQGGHRGDHDRRLRARPRPRRLALHDLPDRPRRGVTSRCTTCATAASSRRSTSPATSCCTCWRSRRR